MLLALGGRHDLRYRTGMAEVATFCRGRGLIGLAVLAEGMFDGNQLVTVGSDVSAAWSALHKAIGEELDS